MAAEQGHDTDRQSDLAVMDANEYKQKRRLERILDALDAVQDRADEAWARYVAGEISRDARNITIQRTVKNAIRECYKLLYDHHKEEDGSERYWAGRPSNAIGKIEIDEGETTTIQGLRDFLDAPTFYTTTITEPVEERNMPDKVVTKTIEYTMPEHVSYHAFLRLKEFLDNVHDMEISFEEMDEQLPNWGFESKKDIPDDAVVL